MLSFVVPAHDEEEDEALFAAEAFCPALGARGDFAILREAVLTSGRKLRTDTGPQLLGTAPRVGLAGPGGVRDRSRLGIWYDRRRPDRHGSP